MRYLGGKSRIAHSIASILKDLQKGRDYLEPFCGGLWVTQEMEAGIANDVSTPLITLYRELQKGWIPPSIVTEDTYAEIKKIKDVNDPMTGFVGFGCSWGGKYFGGYAKDNTGRNYAFNAKNSLLKKIKRCKNIYFGNEPYWKLHPIGSLVYCDPPYAGTTSYDGVEAFDSGKFWETMRQWSEQNTVIISEYSAPEDFICIQEYDTRIDLNSGDNSKKRIEKLFMKK